MSCPHFPRAAAGKKTNQIGIARDRDRCASEIFDHRMADKNRAQPGLFVELDFERKDAEHQV